jgi:hypothetical protein
MHLKIIKLLLNQLVINQMGVGQCTNKILINLAINL